MKEHAFAVAAEALREGEIVGIFPEGKLTETGEINPFRPGGCPADLDVVAGAGERARTVEGSGEASSSAGRDHGRGRCVDGGALLFHIVLRAGLPVPPTHATLTASRRSRACAARRPAMSACMAAKKDDIRMG